jgi:hypothetical protein
VSLRAFRVGVIGARRVREGTGGFLAGHVHAAGCKVVAVAGTALDGAVVAARDLAHRYGIAATPYPSAVAMVEHEALDAVVIASPDATHAPLLDLALDAGLHALVEKPLVYGGGDWVARGTALVTAFAARGLCLVTNAQWRHALPTYLRLFPDVAPRRASRCEMWLAPSVGGRAAVPTAMPHPLSVLDHLYPPATPGLRDLRVTGTPDDFEVAFTHPGRDVACVVRLRRTVPRPRPFAFGFDDAVAQRMIAEPGYAMALATASGDRSVALPDPVEAVVKDFVARVRRGPPFPPEAFALPGFVHLRDVDDAVAAAFPAGP